MNVPCPDPGELTRLLDGEQTENRGAALRTHAAACAGCAAELSVQERLLARLAAPVPGDPAAGAGAVAAVMDRLDAADDAARRSRRPALPRVLVGVTAAVAAVLVAVVVARHLRPAPEDAFAARGVAPGWAQKVGVELWALEGPPRRLASGDALTPGVAVVASYSNVDAAPAYLLSYALDARGEAHWLYPAYLDAAKDPQALRLEGAAVQRALPESVVLQEVPAGPLRLVTVVSREPLRVSAVEAAPPAERTPEALRRRWPAARVDEVVVRYGARGPGGRP